MSGPAPEASASSKSWSKVSADFCSYLTTKVGLAVLNSCISGDKTEVLAVPHKTTVPRLPGSLRPPSGIAPEKTKTPKMAKAINMMINII